ncbi:MAG TPA: DUF456 domain-containing protein [Verrucomicrobiae bacterium]|nr:DUF456 domain-containing protein [Verrucomicrobiae bacterium]
MNTALVITILLLLPGLGMAFVPVIPALLYMFLVSLTYAIVTHFTRLTGWELVLLGFITVAGIAVDQLAGILGARWGGASKKAAIFGLTGMVAGTAIGTPILGFAGLFAGIFLAELTELKTHAEAFKAARGGLMGALAGYVVTIVLAFLFFITFLGLTFRG